VYSANALDPIRVRHYELRRLGSLPQPVRRGAAGAARAVLCGSGGAAVIARVLRVLRVRVAVYYAALFFYQ